MATVARGALDVSPARACAYRVIRRVFEQGAYADRALHSEAAALDARERGFAMALAYAAVQRRATLDEVIECLAGRAVAQLEAPVLATLRLGLTQLLLLDAVAAHAAVDESVRLVKRDAPRATGLVNAILRRAGREGAEIVAAMGDETPERAAVLRSVPLWLARMWFAELGAERARALLAAINKPAESALRVNTLVTSTDQVRRQLPIGATPVAGMPDALVLDGPFDAHGSQLWSEGAIMPQSRGSMTSPLALEPRPGERVLDLCAAPGAKSSQLAALMADTGTLVSVERNARRADGLRRTLRRMRVGCATVLVADAAQAITDGGPFDRVLVDPPCSGLGTLQSRPDLRWRTSPERVADAAQLQATILEAAATATRAGGVVVYSVCTISHAEGPAVIDRFLDHCPDFTADPLPLGGGEAADLQLLPDLHGTDGFYVARLRRR